MGVELAAGSTLKLADLEEKWHAVLDRDPDLSPTTKKRYKQSGVQLLEAFRGVALGALTPLRIRDWIWKRRNERETSTVLNDCNALSHFLKTAIREKWMSGPHPMRDDIVKEAKPQQEHQESADIARYTRAQVEKLLAAEEMPDDVFGLLLVDSTSGQRAGELRGLQWKHTKDPRDGRACLNIQQQALETLDIGAPKWGSKRMIATSPSRLPKSNMRFTGTTSRLMVRASTPVPLRSRTNCDMNLKSTCDARTAPRRSARSTNASTRFS